MLSNRFTKLLLLALSVTFLSLTSSQRSVRAEIIDLDLSGIVVAFEEGDEGLTLANAQRYVAALRRGEAFWDARVLGYSNTLPLAISGQLNGTLVISATNLDIGGGILGQAGFVVDGTTIVDIVRGDSIRRRELGVGRFAIMRLDNDFIRNNSDDDITDVVIHEMGHALGIGTLWRFNDLIQRVGRVGPEQYVGVNARRAYAIETGVAGLARTGFVPLEQAGGGGTAGAHWDDDDPFFNSFAKNRRVELMTGFFVPNTDRFISRTTLASLVDLHYVVKGFNEDELIPYPRQLANRFDPPTPLDDVAGFGSNPFGANEALRESGSSIRSYTPADMYKKRRR
jgi:hypothetical protein